MCYVYPNYKTKKALTTALAEGKEVAVYQPGLGNVPQDGRVTLEGPHFPEPHRWYATGTMQGGKLVKVS